MAVLVDLEIYLPASYIESHIRDRHVLKFPQFVTRVQILHLSKASGLCESRQQRCLVSHNKISVPLQSSTSYEVKNGDYFLVQVPPLEDCVPQEPSHSMNLVQKYVRTFRGLTTPRWALGNAEEAPRDPSHVVGPLCLNFIFPYHICHRYLYESELSSTGPGVLAAFSTPWLREADVEDVMIVADTTYRDPMEGLPDPGNPMGDEIEGARIFTIYSSDEEQEVERRVEEDQIPMTLSTGWDWKEILKLFQRWHWAPNFDIPSCCTPSWVALQYLSVCKVGLQGAHQLWIYTDGSFHRHRGISTFAVGIFGVSHAQQKV